MNCFVSTVLLWRFFPNTIKRTPAKAIKALVVHVEALFLFAFVWSVGCTVDEAGRRQFDAWLKGETASNTSPWLFPKEGTVSSFCQDMQWVVVRSELPL